jgi:hypothetical protein
MPKIATEKVIFAAQYLRVLFVFIKIILSDILVHSIIFRQAAVSSPWLLVNRVETHNQNIGPGVDAHYRRNPRKK